MPDSKENKPGPVYTQNPVEALTADIPFHYPRGADGKTVTFYYTTQPPGAEAKHATSHGAKNLHYLSEKDPHEKVALEAFKAHAKELEARYLMRFVDVTGKDASSLPKDASIWALWGADIPNPTLAYANYPKPGMMHMVVGNIDTYNYKDIIPVIVGHEMLHMLGVKHAYEQQQKANGAATGKILAPELTNLYNTSMIPTDAGFQTNYTLHVKSGYSVEAMAFYPKTFRPLDYEVLDKMFKPKDGMAAHQKPLPGVVSEAQLAAALAETRSDNLIYRNGPGNQHIKGAGFFNEYYDGTGNDIFDAKKDGVNLFYFTSGCGTNTIRGLNTLSHMFQEINIGQSDLSGLRGAENPHFHFEGEVPVLTFSGHAGVCNIRLEDFSGKLSDLSIRGADGGSIHPPIIGPVPARFQSVAHPAAHADDAMRQHIAQAAMGLAGSTITDAAPHAHEHSLPAGGKLKTDSHAK